MPEPDKKKSHPLDYEQPAKPAQPVTPRYRKIFSDILVIMGAVIFFIGCCERVKPAREDVWTVAASFIIIAIVIRFQHVRF